MKIALIVIGILVLGVGIYFIAIKGKTPPPIGNPVAVNRYAPPALPPRVQPAGNTSVLQTVENRAVNLAFDTAGTALKNWLDS